MSDYHILDGDGTGEDSYRVVFHVPVPNENNLVGVNLQAAVAQDHERSHTSLIDHMIVQAERSALTNGELVEILYAYRRDPNKTLSETRDELDQLFTQGTAKIQNRIRAEYKFWGYIRDVP
jgi:hypothetical protein